MSQGDSKTAHADTRSLIKLARQAMGEIDEEEEAKQAKQRQDDEAEEIVHKEHVQVRAAAKCLRPDWFGLKI